MTDMLMSATSGPALGRLAILIGACFVAAVLGSLATTPNLGWHATLAKPPLNPPNWLFAPAWTLLFTLMAIAAWRIWRLPPSETRDAVLMLFAVQLVVNAAWSWAFFGARSTLLGLFVIIPFLILVIATTLAFWRLDRTAGLMMLPYPLWVAFATYLNASMWWLNRTPA
jgi:tryptophan-rich sensory protein